MNMGREIDTMSEEEYLRLLFDSAKDGTLAVPRYYGEDLRWHRPSENPDGADYYDHYIVRWNKPDLDEIMAEYRALRGDLETLAEKAREFGKTEDFECDAQAVRAFLQDERLFEVWNTYVRAWETEGFDPETAVKYYSPESDLELYFDKIAMEEAMADGYQLTDDEQSYYDDIKDTVATEEELAEYDRYWECIAEDARRRVGDAPEALQLVQRAKRLRILLEMRAPSAIIRNEARELALALALHRFATDKERT